MTEKDDEKTTTATTTTTKPPSIPPMFRNNDRIIALFEQKSMEIDAGGAVNATGQSILQQEQLLRLLSHEKLIKMVHDEGLQDIILTITRAPNANLQLLCLRHQIEFNPDFAIFVEVMLNVINGKNDNDNDDNKEIETIGEFVEMLQHNYGNE